MPLAEDQSVAPQKSESCSRAKVEAAMAGVALAACVTLPIWYAAAVVPLPVAVLLLAVSVAPAMPSRTPTRQQWKWPLPSTLQMPPTLLTCRLRLRYHARYLRDLLLLHVLQLARVPLERHRFVGNEGK